MEETFRKRIEQVSDMSCHTESSFQEKRTWNCTTETDFLYSMSQEIFSASPKLDFSTDEWASEEKLFQSLCFSPVQGNGCFTATYVKDSVCYLNYFQGSTSPCLKDIHVNSSIRLKNQLQRNFS